MASRFKAGARAAHLHRDVIEKALDVVSLVNTLNGFGFRRQVMMIEGMTTDRTDEPRTWHSSQASGERSPGSHRFGGTDSEQAERLT